MVAQSRVVKQTARAVWKGDWLKAAAVGSVLLFSQLTLYIISQLLTFAFNTYIINAIMLVVKFFWLYPLAIGVLRVIWRQMLDNDSNIGDAFYYFSEPSLYRKVLYFQLQLGIRIFGIFFVCLFPAITVSVLTGDWIYTVFEWTMPLWLSSLGIISSMLRIIGIILAAFVSIRFYLAPFLFITCDSMDSAEAIHMSTVISRDTVWDFLSLCFSFIGYLILGIFVFPMLFTLPYMLTGLMVHCRFAVAHYNIYLKTVKSFSENYYTGL